MIDPDGPLAAVLASVDARPDALLPSAGFTRRRGGLARGVQWAEASGRADDGAWLELRVHHRPIDRTLQAGLLAYQPLARGGRTVVVGERSLSYREDPREVVEDLADDIADWLVKLTDQSQPAPASEAS